MTLPKESLMGNWKKRSETKIPLSSPAASYMHR